MGSYCKHSYIGIKCEVSTESYECKYLKNYKGSWKDFYWTNWNKLKPNFGIENFSKYGNVCAKRESQLTVINANIPKTLRVIKKVYTEHIGYWILGQFSEFVSTLCCS